MPLYTEEEKGAAYVRACTEVENLRKTKDTSELSFYKGHALGYLQCLQDEGALALEEFLSLVNSLERVANEHGEYLDCNS